MPKSLPNGWDDSLIWNHEKGMGFHPREPMDYGHDYWAQYVEKDNTPMGEALTAARKELVDWHWKGDVVDIGIGGGKFVEAMEARGYGFDVNPEALNWLFNRGSFRDPYEHRIDAITCWDSLEHIPCPEALVQQVNKWVFVSLPIFNDPTRVTESRHYKPGEHIWYWSDFGLIKWFSELGFELAEKSNRESVLGREEIYTYAFRRRNES